MKSGENSLSGFLFSEKNITNWSAAKLAKRVVKVKTIKT